MFLFFIYVVLSSLGLILFKLGTKDLTVLFQAQSFSFSMSWTVLIGILCYLASFFLWLIIVNKSELSYIYPLSIACINIAILIGSYFILQETIDLKSIIGAVIIIVGIIVMKS
jgi:small multidrug resistance pump